MPAMALLGGYYVALHSLTANDHATAETHPEPSVRSPAPIDISLSADHTNVRRGDTVTLSWTVTGDADAISLQPLALVVARRGERPVQINETSTFTLTAKGAAGTNTREITIRVQSTDAEFHAEPAIIRSGRNATLKWKTNAQSIRIQLVGGQELALPGPPLRSSKPKRCGLR